MSRAEVAIGGSLLRSPEVAGRALPSLSAAAERAGSPAGAPALNGSRARPES